LFLLRQALYLLLGGSALSAWLVWLLIYCLRTGAVGARNAPNAHRDLEPFRFWLSITVLAFVTAASIGTVVYLAVSLLG
jgi:hypothetical protein